MESCRTMLLAILSLEFLTLLINRTIKTLHLKRLKHLSVLYSIGILLQKVTYCTLSSPDKSLLFPYIYTSFLHSVRQIKKQKHYTGSIKLLLYDVTFNCIQHCTVTGFTGTGEVFIFRNVLEGLSHHRPPFCFRM